MTTENVDVLIIGAGPTGLGAATRLKQHGKSDWILLDQEAEAGGLACTDRTKEGFYFDMGGHVIFSHYQYFDDLLDHALGSGEAAWNEHQRVSYVWIRDRWVAYPFQNNIAALDIEDQIACINGLVDAKVQNAIAKDRPRDFDEWIMRCLGKGIADLFMRPYNFKVWAVPTQYMQCAWLGERVATADVTRVVSNVLMRREDAGWGPNAIFRFPKSGGTGAIWKGVAKLLPPENLRFGNEYRVQDIDVTARTVTTVTGKRIKYKNLISSLPLDIMLRMPGVNRPDLADGLQHSSSHIVGIGIRGYCPHGKKCWLYYPESNCPYYRCTIFSNYAAANCPDGATILPTLCRADCGLATDTSARPGPYWSLMFEISESILKPVDQTPCALPGQGGKWPAVVLETMLGAIATKLVKPEDEIISIYHRRVEHGYPTPSLGRDAVLDQALPWLRSLNVWSRGRFGSYKYEVANQDHSLMLGVECVDNLLIGAKEITLHHPDIVNAKKNTELMYKRD